MNLIKVKDVVIDFDKVIGFEPGVFDDTVDVYFYGKSHSFCLSLNISDFCRCLKFYNIDIKELK